MIYLLTFSFEEPIECPVLSETSPTVLLTFSFEVSIECPVLSETSPAVFT